MSCSLFFNICFVEFKGTNFNLVQVLNFTYTHKYGYLHQGCKSAYFH
jgi:hypothetical protein